MTDSSRRKHLVHAQLAREPFPIELCHLGPDGIDAEASRFAADVDGAVIHAVTQILSGVAADHHAAALHHEAGEGSGVAANDDGAALLVNAGAGADRSLAHEIAAANGGAELRACILLDEDRAGEHVFAASPADATLDPDVGAVKETAGKITAAAFDIEIEPVQYADGKRVLGAGILEDDRAIALFHQIAQ